MFHGRNLSLYPQYWHYQLFENTAQSSLAIILRKKIFLVNKYSDVFVTAQINLNMSWEGQANWLDHPHHTTQPHPHKISRKLKKLIFGMQPYLLDEICTSRHPDQLNRQQILETQPKSTLTLILFYLI